MYDNDGLLFLLRALGGEENVIEHMEAEGQQNAIRRTQMAKKLQPSKEVWESHLQIFLMILFYVMLLYQKDGACKQQITLCGVTF